MLGKQIIFRPLDSDPRVVGPKAEPGSRYDQLLERWADLFFLKKSELSHDLDREDWAENAVRLLAAVSSGLPTFVVDRTSGRANDVDVIAGFNTNSGLDYPSPSIFLGTHLINDPLHPFQADKEGPLNLVWPRPGTDKAANKYWKNQPLLDAMGRAARIADNCADGPSGYVAQVHELLRAGVRDFMVKIVSPAKYQAPVRVTLEENANDESIKAAFFDAFGWALIHIEDQRNCFLVQEHIDLGFEYRMIVVGGQVVAGAGAIDSLCPVDMVDRSAAFDAQVERKRNDGLVVLKDDLVASYAAFAADVARAAAEASPNLVDYTLDLAVNLETEEIVVIEANPLENFGLYAMDYRRILNAMIQECDSRSAAAAAWPGAGHQGTLALF